LRPHNNAVATDWRFPLVEWQSLFTTAEQQRYRAADDATFDRLFSSDTLSGVTGGTISTLESIV